MRLNQSQIDELKNLIARALYIMYENDYYLIEHKVNERSLVFRFGLYFSQLLTYSKNFHDYNLDCEYNRNLGQPKRTENFPKGVLPDVLLHKRNSNEENILVIEFKGKWNTKGRKKDKQKLKDFTNQEGEYAYALGAFIDLWDTEPLFKYFQDYDTRVEVIQE